MLKSGDTRTCLLYTSLFYGSTGVTLKNGDEILAGFNGKKTTYKGEAELVVNTYSNFHKGANLSLIHI